MTRNEAHTHTHVRSSRTANDARTATRLPMSHPVARSRRRCTVYRYHCPHAHIAAPLLPHTRRQHFQLHTLHQHTDTRRHTHSSHTRTVPCVDQPLATPMHDLHQPVTATTHIRHNSRRTHRRTIHTHRCDAATHTRDIPSRGVTAAARHDGTRHSVTAR
jgi:hypothetical protein